MPMSEKIGLFGGSFDPVHKGHISIMQSALDDVGLDRLIVIPASDPPHKNKSDMLEASQRLLLLHEALDNIMDSRIEISDYEINKNATGYSFETVLHFKEIYPDDRLYFIMGYDSLRDLDTWKNPEIICENADLLVAGRDGVSNSDAMKLTDEVSKRYNCGVLVLSMKQVDISSSKIRQMLAKNPDSLLSYIPSEVFALIYLNGFYGVCDLPFAIPKDFKPVTEKLKETLKHTRFIHTLGVAYTAAQMALKWGCDMNDAILAALLHDCAKCNSDAENLEILKNAGIEVTKSEINAPQLLHSKAGTLVAKDIYGIEDEKILNAIRLHTTGAPDMSLLEKIIFIADYIEPGRYKIKNLPYIRRIAFEDIDLCLVKIFKNTINYINRIGGFIDPQAVKAYDYYLNKTKGTSNE